MEALQQFARRSFSILLFFFLLYCFILLEPNKLSFHIPESLLNVNTIFLSILLESIPFIMLGIFFSSCIEFFVSDEWMTKWIVKNPYGAIGSAVVISILSPVCECAVIPVVRRLIQKGLPLHVGSVILVGAPILNPIVILSTYYAFSKHLELVYARIGLAIVICIITGLMTYWIFGNKNMLKPHKTDALPEHSLKQQNGKRLKPIITHAVEEFFDMGRYLIMGAFIASLFQTFLNRGALAELGTSDLSGSAVMMGLAFVLSLCSHADAFVASTFSGTYSHASLLSFMLYGPMLDFKNTFVYASFFKKRFVFVFSIIISASVLAIAWLYGLITA
ncbi:permease [Bacillus inaquosorum]|uniref:permease n=1 Tax=Bacillus inaquosorum TaxID=483913 RepID=UPI00227E1264|nr:permease [Bacillus inaquosorum]MCY7903916.1 permease [Bacillus inaquosorum]MCY7928338.1 permease [Bacillus inaquosorum]MCY8770357.1 permease [Bacillus inaquosorum]MCY9012160.1 permease [Bacillus inaquosorum]MCY9039973.1 permease [Bacillus inaquosorum]